MEILAVVLTIHIFSRWRCSKLHCSGSFYPKLNVLFDTNEPFLICQFQKERLVMSEPRRRTQIKRYGQDDATLDMSDLGSDSGPSAESDDDTSLGVGRGRGKKSKLKRRRKLLAAQVKAILDFSPSVKMAIDFRGALHLAPRLCGLPALSGSACSFNNRNSIHLTIRLRTNRTDVDISGALQ